MPEKPVIFLAFANEQTGNSYLRDLPREARELRELLQQAVDRGLCELEFRPNATLDEITKVFLRYGRRIKIFHYGGHAGPDRLWLESASGGPHAAHAGGLARYLGLQAGLQLVVLNGCSTGPQVADLLAAGVDAVVATRRSVGDEVARAFAVDFFTGLVANCTFDHAFELAIARARANRGDSPRDFFPDDSASGPEDIADVRGFPWRFFIRDGAEAVKLLTLPQLAGNPLLGLPPLPSGMWLPPSPYRHLQRFTRTEAHVFFGRGRDIAELYHLVTSPTARRVVLYSGPTGVGKSSVLDAGLLSRLEVAEPRREVLYARRDDTVGLLGTLLDAVAAPGTTPLPDLASAWHARDQPERPLVAILDQAEESFTRPRTATTPSAELGEFVAALKDLFDNPAAIPHGRLIVSFRKEWLAEFEHAFDEARMGYESIRLFPLDRAGVVEAIEGPTLDPDLRRHYGVTVEPGLADRIATELEADAGSALAPTLQVLLTKLWESAGGKRSTFTHDQYNHLKDQGYLLNDVLDAAMKALWNWNPDAVGSGFALDLLEYHTTPIGTAQTRTRADLEARYPLRTDVLGDCLQICERSYLLIPAERARVGTSGEASSVRLGHDTLAPPVQYRFRQSDAPGQRARRILENRAIDWEGGKIGPVLDRPDLATVEAGRSGMPVWTPDQERLVQASHQAQRRERARERRRAARLRDARRLAAARIVAGDPARRAALLREVEDPKHANHWMENAADTARTPAWWCSPPGTSGETNTSPVFLRGGEILAARAMHGLTHLAVWRIGQIGQPNEHRFPDVPLGGGASVNDFFLFADVAHDRLLVLLLNATLESWQVETGTDLKDEGFSDDLEYGPGGSIRYPAPQRVEFALQQQWDGLAGNFDPQRDLVESAGFAAPGRRLVTCHKDGAVRVWDLSDEAPPSRLPWTLEGKAAQPVQVSPDGRTAVFLTPVGATLMCLDATNGWSRRLEPPRGLTYAADFSQDSAAVVVGYATGTAVVWSTKDGKFLQEMKAESKDDITAVAFHPDGTRIVTGSRGGVVTVWPFKPHAAGRHSLSSRVDWIPSETIFHAEDMSKFRQRIPEHNAAVSRRAHQGKVRQISFDPKSRRMVTTSEDGVAGLWPPDGLGSPAPLGGPDDPVDSAVFSPDGRRLVTVAAGHPPRVWRTDWAADPLLLPPFPLLSGGNVSQIALESTDDGDVIWTLFWHRGLRRTPIDGTGHEDLIEFRCDLPGSKGQRSRSDRDLRWMLIQSDDGAARLFPLRSERDPFVLGGVTADLNDLAVSRDGRWVVGITEDGAAWLWDADRPATPASLDAGRGPFTVAAFGPDGQHFATGSADGTVCVWTRDDLMGPNRLWRWFPGRITQIDFSFDGSWLLAQGEGGLLLAGVTAEPIQVLGRSGGARFIGGGPTALAVFSDSIVEITPDGWRQKRTFDLRWQQVRTISPDGRWLVTTQHGDDPRVWNTEKALEPVVLHGAGATLTAVAASPDGRRVLTGHRDGWVAVWTVEVDPEVIRERLWRATSYCLTVEDRMRLLAEDLKQAVRNRKAALAKAAQYHANLS